MADELIDLDLEVVHSTQDAILLSDGDTEDWVPWSLIAADDLLRWFDFSQAHKRLITYVGRKGRTETAPFYETLVAEKIVPYITAAGRAKIAYHKNQGHRVVLISASIEELIKPLAQHLGLAQDYLCTHLEVQNNRYTGELEGLPCYGVGKVYWAREWAMTNGLDFPQTVGYFYTDSSSDLPLLELAAQPVAVNPSRKLTKIAKARGWPVERFD